MGNFRQIWLKLTSQALVVMIALFSTNFSYAEESPTTKSFTLDSDRQHFAQIDWDAPLRSEETNWAEFESYNDVVLHANKYSAQELFDAGDKVLTFRDLLHPRTGRDFQFKLVAFEGRMMRLRRIEPTIPLKQAGVKNLYESWIFPSLAADPLCLLLVDPPEGIPESMSYQRAVPVKFGGFYFKLIQYESSEPSEKKDRNRVRRAPLLISRGLLATPEPTDISKPWREGFLPGISMLVSGVFLVAVALTVWFRLGDRGWRQRAETRRNENPFLENADRQTVS
jgi:hypothetical protein